MAGGFSSALPDKHFQIAPVEQLPFEDGKFNLVISRAVLPFAQNSEHFEAMPYSMWRVFKPRGYFFAAWHQISESNLP